jgi:uncharacterized protein (DUF302 family)
MTSVGLVTLPSRYGPAETKDSLIAAVERSGMSVFAHIDHAAAAHAVGLELRPTEVFLLGNPRAGTVLMQDLQTVGIDLPLKVLLWQDDAQRTWVSYYDPKFLAQRHGVSSATGPTVAAMSAALVGLARAATGGEAS